MSLYHMSQTLALGDELKADFDRISALCQPFIQALERGEECFYTMVLNGKYLFAVLSKFRLREWSDYAKWATEGAFEYIRRTEYPDCPSRLYSMFYYDDLTNCRKLYEYDWGEETEEERNKVHLFEIELQDPEPKRFDMCLYDAAYDAMSDHQDVQAVLENARAYFSGGRTDRPVWEILSDRKAVAVKDVTEVLR